LTVNPGQNEQIVASLHAICVKTLPNHSREIGHTVRSWHRIKDNAVDLIPKGAPVRQRAEP